MVVVEFVVTDKGELINPKALRSAGPNLDQEALRIIGLMPTWTPGKQNGRPVNVKYMLPFRFKMH
jgi:TonB family protein